MMMMMMMMMIFLGAVGQGCNLQAAMVCVGNMAPSSDSGLDCE